MNGAGPRGTVSSLSVKLWPPMLFLRIRFKKCLIFLFTSSVLIIFIQSIVMNANKFVDM